VDLMQDAATGELFVLEADAVPGLTDTSLLPQAAEAAGIGFDALVAGIVASALTPRRRSPPGRPGRGSP
jgi:D-alanine-D-alanine ligase